MLQIIFTKLIGIIFTAISTKLLSKFFISSYVDGLSWRTCFVWATISSIIGIISPVLGGLAFLGILIFLAKMNLFSAIIFSMLVQVLPTVVLIWVTSLFS